MNKVIAILGVIVLITLGALFFCVGFFTGTTMPSFNSGRVGDENSEDMITRKKVDSTIAAQSGSISDKVLKILSMTSAKDSNRFPQEPREHIVKTRIDPFQMSQESLLKEIIATHAENDDCSSQKTQRNIQTPKADNPDSLRGKKVVFIGYFKDNIALQIQKLLMGKGYKVHIEPSKTTHGESFVFCGPFKKTENAEKLASWLQKHSFSEAKVMNITQEELEGTLYDSLYDGSAPPFNEEKEIPEVTNTQMNAMQNAATRQGTNAPQVGQVVNANQNVPNVTATPTTNANIPMQNYQNVMNQNPQQMRPANVPVQNYPNGMNQNPQMMQQGPVNQMPMVQGIMRPQAMPLQQNPNMMMPQQNVGNFR